MVTKTENLRKMPVGLLVGIGLLVIALVGLAFWLGQRDTVRLTMTSEEKAFVEQTTGLSYAELEKIAEEGQKTARQLIEQRGGEAIAPVAPVAPATVPAGFKTGNWTETIQTKFGQLKISYTISSTLKDKIKSRLVAKDTDGRARIYLISPGSVGSTVFLTWKGENGQVLADSINRPLSPNEERDVMVDREGMTSVNVEVR